MSALILPKLGLCRDRHEATDKLKSMGARYMTEGGYASVYSVEIDTVQDEARSLMPAMLRYDVETMRILPNYRDEPVVRRMTRVVKVARSDPGGLIAAKAAMLTHEYDPLAPVYYGIVEFGNGDWMGEMEMLRPINRYVDNMDTCGHGKETSSITGGSREPLGSVMMASPYLQIVAKIVDASRASGRRPCRWDLHGENVMMRGNQPVVTDPIAA